MTKRTKEAKNLIARTEPPIDPDHLVPTQCMNIYAEKVDTPLFGRKGSVVVYVNTERRMREREVMKKIGKFLPKSCTKFFNYSVQEGQTGSELTWSANTDARIEAERRDGKYLLYATDPSLSGSDVVMKYFERDFVEKVFRDLKLFEEIAPIRHRKESRILGIMVVCTLALRLKVALRTMLEGAKDEDLSGEQFLKQIGRVHQVDLQMDNDVQVWYVGLQKKLEKVLEEIGMKGLFGERVRCRGWQR